MEETIIMNKTQKDILDYIKKNSKIKLKCIKGYNCNEIFFKDIINLQKDKQITFISFNGVNFDNIIFLNWLNENQPESIRNPFFSNNQLLDFTLNGRHKFFDIRKHLSGSLKKCCESFNIKSLCKSSLDHSHYQNIYNESPIKLIEEINKDKKIDDYNNLDVLSTGILFYRWADIFKNIKGYEEIGNNMKENRTIGGIIYKKAVEFWKKNDVNSSTALILWIVIV